ncbi:pyridoxamine 5'-phosphate oxidase family protein [Geoglobus acetivorans]|uniref:Pyridoxamine 5'-phosphate oxidase N-terminal domain-containing protein n=1 Tax=Geoglobus acetivorans TaxID=565033 RepID=A0A0A7GEM4_GEOAI|nr:hypothetical protein GACE_0311 [Geoglobus acetivorans]
MIPYEVRSLLNTTYFGYLCTRATYPHITPVFFVYDQRDGVYFMSTFGSRKIRNIASDRRVSLVIDVRDENDPFNNEGVMISGIARLYLPEQFKSQDYGSLITVYNLFREKYAEFVEPVHGDDDVLVRIEMKRLSYWKGPQFMNVRLHD